MEQSELSGQVATPQGIDWRYQDPAIKPEAKWSIGRGDRRRGGCATNQLCHVVASKNAMRRSADYARMPNGSRVSGPPSTRNEHQTFGPRMTMRKNGVDS